MNFIIELQILPDNTPACIVRTEPDDNIAESEYHRILSFAAVSSIPVHTAVILSETGNSKKKESYAHAQPVEEPPVEEPIEEL